VSLAAWCMHILRKDQSDGKDAQKALISNGLLKRFGLNNPLSQKKACKNMGNVCCAAEKASAGTDAIATAIVAWEMTDPRENEHDCIRSRTALRMSERFSNLRTLFEIASS